MCSYEPPFLDLDLDVFMDDLDDDFELDFRLEPSSCHSSSDTGAEEVQISNCVELVEDDHEPEDEHSDECSDTSELSAQVTPPVIDHVEDMVLSFLSQLAFPGKYKDDDELSERSDIIDQAPLKTDYKVKIRLADRRKGQIDGVSASKYIHYPRRHQHGSSKPLAQLFRVLDLAHEATLNEIPATKRDIYYQDVPLFKKQKVVDELVDDLAATFQLERSDLNIRSSSKGLVCGSGLTITLISGDIIRCNDSEGSLIPAGEDIETFAVDSDVSWVLVVEKEAVFQTLCHLQISKHDSMPGPGIMITGKGYPDVATRHIVKSLGDALPISIPILGLVDADPFGLDILSVYRYGSRSMQHESNKLATKRIKWLGVWASELESLDIDKIYLLPITKHDEKKALGMLRRKNMPMPKKWKKELQHMLHSRRKAEIEIFSNQQNYTADISEELGGRFADKKQNPGDRQEIQLMNAPHGLLLRYLESKIKEFMMAAQSTRIVKSASVA